MKIEDIKKRFVITPDISALKINIDILLVNKEKYLKILKNSILFTVVSLFLGILINSYTLFVLSTFFNVFIGYLLYKDVKEFKFHINTYNQVIMSHEDEISKFYLIHPDMKLHHVNNYNIFFSNLLKSIKNKEIECSNLNFIDLLANEFSEDIYQKQKQCFPYLFDTKRNNKKNNVNTAVEDFFNIANTRFNLANNVIYFIDLYEKKLDRIYIIIDDDSRYAILEKDLPILRKELLLYSFALLDTRIEFNKTRNFEHQKQQQAEISNQIHNLLRSTYLKREVKPDVSKKEIRHRKKI